MIATIAKWGNSLAVRIPIETARDLSVGAGSQLELAVEDGVLLLRPIVGRRPYDLDALVAGITRENRHDETSTGAAVEHEF